MSTAATSSPTISDIGPPVPAIRGIDHLLVGVRELEAAASQWRRLGFHLTPRGRHIGWGTGNYCIMFEHDYLEILGILDDNQFTNNLDTFLKSREGLMGLAFETDDAAACVAQLRAAGIAPEGPTSLKRVLELPDGDVLPAFELVMLPRDATPGLSAFACRHLTPQLLRQPSWLHHANRAKSVVSITVVVDDPTAAVFDWLPIFGGDRIKTANLVTVIDTGRGHIRFTSKDGLAQLYPALEPLPQHPAPWIAAMKIAVADIARCRDHLRFEHVLALKTGKGCLVPPEEANGVIIEFVEE